MDFKEVVKNRRSVRDYDSSKPITNEQLARLFELVCLSPSSYNLQPWEFIVVRSAENKERLQRCAQNQPHVSAASATIIVLGNINPEGKAKQVAKDRIDKGSMDKAKYKLFLSTIKALSADRDKATLWAIRSTSLAAMTLMLAAKDMGIESCPMEGFDPDCVKKEFDIPDNYVVVMLVTLGFQSKAGQERPMRFSSEDNVYSEKFGKRLSK